MNPEENIFQLNSDYLYDPELFFELSLDLLCIAGYDGYFKKINPAVSKLLGYTEEELFAKPINDFIYWEDQNVTDTYRDGLKKRIPLLNFENRYLTKGGEVIWLSWTSIPLDSKQIIYAIAKNVTYKKQLEEGRNELFVNLTKINNDLKQLTYKASHDLRSPVNNLLSIFSLLDLSKIQDEETLEFMGVLKSTTEGLKESLNDYVEILSKNEGLSVELEELGLNTSLNVVLKSINSLIQESNAIIKVDFSEVETVIFNKSYLGSIFLNLLTNSIKYARSGFAPSISIQSKKANGYHQLIFTDEGLGFDMEKVKDRIFGLHQKFHHHIDSKGIGLYLIYNQITSLGGKITVESEINKGAKFIISFKGE